MNKRMIWILPFLILPALFLASCSDDDKTTAFNKLKERLALTEEKTALVQPIFMDQADKISAILEETNNNRSGIQTGSTTQSGQGAAGTNYGSPELHIGGMPQLGQGGGTAIFNSESDHTQEKLDAVNKDADAKLAAILTPNQITAYDRIIKGYIRTVTDENNSGSSPRGHRGGRGGRGGMGGMGSPGGGF
jgi:hypothetical protein